MISPYYCKLFSTGPSLLYFMLNMIHALANNDQSFGSGCYFSLLDVGVVVESTARGVKSPMNNGWLLASFALSLPLLNAERISS